MKKLILVDIILVILVCIIPDANKNIVIGEIINEEIEEEIIEQKENNLETEKEIAQVSSRSLEEARVETIKKNTELTVDSNLRELSNLTAEEFDKILENTNLRGLGSTLVEIETNYHINGLYMIGLAGLESSFGNSNIAKTKNNITGFCAYDRNTGKAKVFDSYGDCLLTTARLLDKNYLTENGCYFNGYSAKAIDVKYCSDKTHAIKIVKIVNDLVKKLEV